MKINTCLQVQNQKGLPKFSLWQAFFALIIFSFLPIIGLGQVPIQENRNSEKFFNLLNQDKIEEANQMLENDMKIEISLADYKKYHAQIIYKQFKTHYLKGEYFQAISKGKEYIALNPEKTKMYGRALTYMGNAHYSIKEYGIALDFYFKSKDLHLSLSDWSALGMDHQNIGLIYKRINDNEQAIFHYKKGLEIIKVHRPKKTAYGYTSIARLLILTKDFGLAKIYLDSGNTAAVENQQTQQKNYIIESYGYLYQSQKQFKKAIEFYESSLSKSLSINKFNSALNSVIQLIDLYDVIGDKDKSIALAEQYLDMAIVMNNGSDISSISEILHQHYLSNDAYRKVIDLDKKVQPALIRINEEKKKLEDLRVKIRMESRLQANENKVLKQQKLVDQQTIHSQNIFLYSTVIVLLLMVVIIILVYRALVIKKNLSTQILKQSEKLKQLDQAKSRFFANISHDLRTPLTLIMGGIDQVLNSPDTYLTTKSERQLKTGLQNCERIIHLTNEINELIKLEEGKLIIEKKYINIDAMLRLFVKMFSSMAEMRGIKLAYSKSIFDESPIVHIDPQQFEKILFNLITNALKHTNRGDTVNILLNLENKQLHISVIDSGEGIPAENIPFIFERYYQAPDVAYKTQQGFGIGLALVKEIISKHKAKISVKSKLGEGSEFIVTLPLEFVDTDQVTVLGQLQESSEKQVLFKNINDVSDEDRPIVHVQKSKEIVLNKDKCTVLIVEDHPEVRDFINDIIASKYNVLTASNGLKALKVLAKEKIDLIITDLMMPFFDGFELLEKLKEDDRLKSIPVLVLSARTSEEDKMKVLSNGVNEFLCKPFNPSELTARIENLLNRKEIWNSNQKDALFINNTETLNEVEQSLYKTVERLVMEKIDDPTLSIGYLADQIAVSERKFYRLIKKLTDSTPLELIKEIRMQYAMTFIKEKDITNASEVAKAIGMTNVSHFNTHFKKRFGQAPSDII